MLSRDGAKLGGSRPTAGGCGALIVEAKAGPGLPHFIADGNLRLGFGELQEEQDASLAAGQVAFAENREVPSR